MTVADENELLAVADFLNTDESVWEDSTLEQSTVNRYKGKKFLDAGGMKEIYEVYDAKTCRKLAFAQLKKDGKLWHCESFLNEAYLTASLSHPNIISVYDVGLQENDEPYFTMELKVGATLKGLVEEAPDMGELLQVFLKVCDAVSYAHSVGILHLDIKPDNIQVGRHGEVKLCDWGLSCKVEDLQGDSEFIKGTPGFMSPEQICKGEICFQTDIYSLGALLYYILTLSVPFEGGVETMVKSTLTGEFVAPMGKCPDAKIPSSLDAVVRKAMQVEKAERYKSVEKLKADVNNYLTGHSTNAENADFVKECLLFYNRNKQSSLISLIFLTVFFVTVSIFIENLNSSKLQVEQTLAELKESHVYLQKAQKQEQQAFRQSAENYQKYIAQKERQLRVSLELKEKNLETAFASVLYPVYFFDPEGSLDKSTQIFKSYLQKTPDSAIEQQIILNLFISHKFSEIAQYRPTFTQPLADLAARYRGSENYNGKILTFDAFLRVLRDLNNLDQEHQGLRESVFERMVYFYKQSRRINFVNIKVLQELLISMNPDWREERFEYSKPNKKLIVSGLGLTTINSNKSYNSKKCIFSLVSLDVLVVRKTGISKPYQFDGLSVKKLDIRNTEIDSINPYSAFREISEIEIAPGNFPKMS